MKKVSIISSSLRKNSNSEILANEFVKGAKANGNEISYITPVYYYAVSGQLKTFIDRMNPVYNMDYKFKDIYVI